MNNVTPEEFVKTWQTSNSVREVASKTGMTEGAVRGRECMYRKYGVSLKHFPKKQRSNFVDWKKIDDLAKELG